MMHVNMKHVFLIFCERLDKQLNLQVPGTLSTENASYNIVLVQVYAAHHVLTTESLEKSVWM